MRDSAGALKKRVDKARKKTILITMRNNKTEMRTHCVMQLYLGPYDKAKVLKKAMKRFCYQHDITISRLARRAIKKYMRETEEAEALGKT